MEENLTPLQAAFAIIDANAANELHAATAKGLMTGYHAKWSSEPIWTLSVEQEFHLPVINPNTGRRSKIWTYAGKFDGVVENQSGKRLLIEHKSTGDSIEDPDAPYWLRLDIDSQIDTYSIANLQLGEPVDGILYDVIRKPSIRPKKKKDGATETPAEFAERLSQDTLERPDFYFGRKVIYRLENQMTEAACEMWDTAQEMALARKHGRHYRNSNACLAWGYPCEYLPICSGRASIDDPRYTRRERIMTELPMVSENNDCSNILTHSRMAAFKQCRRKAHLRYDERLQKADKEDSEALAFGTLLHLGLAEWFSFFRKEAACPA